MAKKKHLKARKKQTNLRTEKQIKYPDQNGNQTISGETIERWGSRTYFIEIVSWKWQQGSGNYKQDIAHSGRQVGRGGTASV